MNKTRVMVAMAPTAFKDDLIIKMGHEGFEVISASGGHEALEKLRKYSVDEIVIQLNLPQFDGLELILNIRDLRLSVPIIVIGFNDFEMEKEVLQAGASMFLHYPVDPSAVIDLIKHKTRLDYEEKNP